VPATKAIDTSTFRGKVAERIRARRTALGLSVEDAAGRAGVAAPTWYHWEAGHHLRLDRLPAIAAALGCSVKAMMP
jgi:transcriptional regulator with XRE-family HTH domain